MLFSSIIHSDQEFRNWGRGGYRYGEGASIEGPMCEERVRGKEERTLAVCFWGWQMEGPGERAYYHTGLLRKRRRKMILKGGS